MKTDPVCGQSIDPLRARAVVMLAGETYYFCSADHRTQFMAAPARFVSALRPAVVVEEPIPVPMPPMETGPTPLPILAEGSPVPMPPRPRRAPTAPPRDLHRFEIGGMTGAEDAERVRKAMARVPGVAEIEIDLVTEVATVAAERGFKAAALVESVATAGYEAAARAGSPRADLDALRARAEGLARRAVVAFALALPLAFSSWAPLSIVAVLFGAVLLGRPRGVPELVAIAGALLCAWGAPAGTLALVGLSLAIRAVEARAKHAAATAIAGLAALPESARRVGDEGVSTSVAVEELVAGETVRIAAGEVVPVDGVVRSGSGQVDESQVSGTAAPVAREAGDPAVAGSTLASGTLLVEVKRAGRDRTLARLRSAVLELQGSTSPLLRLAARSETWAPLAAAAAALVAAVVQLATGHPLRLALAAAGVVAAFMPLLPALATEAALAIATVRAARRGVCFRNAEAFERARDVGLVVVDKSATLTQGRRQVAATAIAEGADARRLVALAAAAEQMSDAPLARALRAHAEKEGILVPPADRASFSPGRGVTATVAGTEVLVGSRRFLEEAGIDRARLDALKVVERLSSVFVAIDGVLAGALAIDEPLRTGAARFVAALGELGVRVALVTGDGEAAARAVAAEAGIDEVFADLGPDEKKRIVVGLGGGRGAVAVVGDGIDDEAALAAADVGIALGRGADLALAAASVTVVRGDLDGVLAALAGARRGVGVMRRNLALVGVHALLATAASALIGGPVVPLVLGATTAALCVAIFRASLRA